MEYYRYHLQFRKTDGSKYIFLAGRLSKQYIVDMYSTMEMNRLNWMRGKS